MPNFSLVPSLEIGYILGLDISRIFTIDYQCLTIDIDNRLLVLDNLLLNMT